MKKKYFTPEMEEMEMEEMVLLVGSEKDIVPCSGDECLDAPPCDEDKEV